MKIIQKGLLLEGEKYYEKHLEIINPFLPVQFTNMEIKVLALFMSFEGEVAKEDRFGTSLRKMAMNKLKIEAPGLSNYITALKKKGAIVTQLNGTLDILPLLLSEDREQFYQFKLIKKI